MEKIINTAIRWHDDSQKPVLALVVETWGSAPRQPGSMMIVRNDQAFEGSVSGGCVESSIIAEAGQILHFGGAKAIVYQISNDDALSAGLICGGRLKVLLIKLEDKHIDTLSTVSQKINDRQDVVLSIDLKSGDMSIARFASDELLSSESYLIEDETLYLPYRPKPRMIITGAVDTAQALTPMAQSVGFDVTIIDPRGAFIENRKFGEATLVKDWPDDVLDGIPIDVRTAIVTLTHDSKLDDAALVMALRSKAGYIGSLGSKRTHHARLDRLRELGFKDDTLNRIHAPIGLDIGAQTPQEIAVSIIAEIVQVMRSA